MITVQLSAAEAKFLADCISARKCATLEAAGDAVDIAEREGFFALLAMGNRLHQQLTIAAFSDERHKLARSAQ